LKRSAGNGFHHSGAVLFLRVPFVYPFFQLSKGVRLGWNTIELGAVLQRRLTAFSPAELPVELKRSVEATPKIILSQFARNSWAFWLTGACLPRPVQGNMKTDTKNQNGTKTQASLAELNAKILELQQRRVALAQPLKDRYAELRTELVDTERQIRELDETWKAEPLKPRAEAKIAEILQAKGRSMTEAEIMAALGNLFTKYKVKKTLEKRFSVDAGGKYSVKA
jgi:hypothetical protein